MTALTLRQPQPRQSFRWSWRVGSVAGVELRVHLTAVLFALWLMLEHARTQSWEALTEGFVLTVCVLASVVLHEFGHALAARRFGVRARDLTLLPIGAVTTFDRPLRHPRHELLVALAGPSVNLALAALCLGALMAAQLVVDVRALQLVGGPFLAKLFMLNLSLAAFNLLPAFPMDGGRVLRAALALRRPRFEATRLAAAVARVFAVLFAVGGVFVSAPLLLVALFVWFGAEQELLATPAEDVMLTTYPPLDGPFVSVQRATPLAEVAALLDAHGANTAVVIERGAPVGVVTRESLGGER